MAQYSINFNDGELIATSSDTDGGFIIRVGQESVYLSLQQVDELVDFLNNHKLIDNDKHNNPPVGVDLIREDGTVIKYTYNQWMMIKDTLIPELPDPNKKKCK